MKSTINRELLTTTSEISPNSAAGANRQDFRTGQELTGGQAISASAPIERMPLFVRAGSVLPFCPAIQCPAESVDPMETTPDIVITYTGNEIQVKDDRFLESIDVRIGPAAAKAVKFTH